MTIEATDENFEQETNTGVVLVDFYAPWCQPCKMLSPVLDEVNETLKVVKVNIDDVEDLPQEYGVRGVPTLILMKDGEVVSKRTGYVNSNDLHEWVALNI